MKKVSLLPEHVISKIAAGEVIDRPAAVVKELLENAIDAGATHIKISLKDAGKTLIQLKDNGSGIDADDLEDIFLRHATSKIQSADDLFNIHSLGFRGEALYSIAAIGDILAQTKTQDSDSGWEIHLRGSKQLDKKPCTFSETGTNIEVKELFFNTPARRKFLKTDTTELNQILNTFIPYTLLHPNIQFQLLHQGKTLIDLKRTNDYRERLAAALNLEKRFLLENQSTFDEEQIKLHVILGDINISRPRRDLQFLFVNNRPIQNKNISFHINQIYRLMMFQGNHPAFAIYIDVPPEAIDVNIHPTKREVKFSNETKICNLLRNLCEQTLMTQGQIKEAKDDSESVSSPSLNALNKTYSQEATYDRALPNAIFEESASVRERSTSSSTYAYPHTNDPKNNTPSHTQTSGQEFQNFFLPKDAAEDITQLSLQAKLKSAQYIGSFMNKFILFEYEQAMIVIDQHAAAERITYEHLITQMDKGNIEIQHLLTPVHIQLTPQEYSAWEAIKEDLENLGFSNSPWKDNAIAIHSYPYFVKDIETAVRNILAGERLPKGDHDALARRACRSSIMAGDPLNKEQILHQREQLIKCLDPFTCPHGRPTMIELSENFLDKQFLRT